MKKRISLALGLAAGLVLALAAPAAADHTDPRTQIFPDQDLALAVLRNVLPIAGLTQGEGAWEHIATYPYPPVDGGGSDHKFFTMDGNIYVAVGTLGQHDLAVGQRILKLTGRGDVNPSWVADHGSASCPPQNQSVTGLQHDQAFLGSISAKGLKRIDKVPARSLVVTPEILLDTTDATGRCHDTAGGGVELVDITGLTDPSFEPREIHLTRHQGTTHTVTVDDTRPWIFYPNASGGTGTPWIDVVDARSCLGLAGLDLEEKREKCRPLVYRIPFEEGWTAATCHDLTSRRNLIYCAALNATLIFDVGGIVGKNGGLKGKPLECEVVSGTETGAMVTDCTGAEASKKIRLQGWKFLGIVHHDGANPSDQDISISHQAYPTPDGEWMFVTDERGGGVAPPGATCAPVVDNTMGNGGVHVFDISDPQKIEYALGPDGEKAIWRSEPQIPSPTFCDVHVIEKVPGEQRFFVAYYTQGVKVLDYFIDEEGRFTFEETASIILPNANVWTASPFKIVDNGDGTKTYSLVASDIYRGIDILSWTGPTNPEGAKRARTTFPVNADVGMAMLGVFGLILSAGRAVRPKRRG